MKEYTHKECLRTGKCQETEGFKGTEHEGTDVCEDGCVWWKPENKNVVHHENKKDFFTFIGGLIVLLGIIAFIAWILVSVLKPSPL